MLLKRTFRFSLLLLLGFLFVGGFGEIVGADLVAAQEAVPPGGATTVQVGDAQALMQQKCSGCHVAGPDGSLSRISLMRKTPEGWALTLYRMKQVEGVNITDDDIAAITRYLSDQQGLAPSETAPYRYALDHTPNVVEPQADNNLSVLCARCHTYARIALERRDANEWLQLANTHGGLFPTAEYQNFSRDRLWWQIVTTDVPRILGQKYPLDTAEWATWVAQDKPSWAGSWHVFGHQPGPGDYGGTVSITSTGPDQYSLTYDLMLADGESRAGSSTGLVYTGYDWRGTGQLGGQDTNEAYAIAPDGNSFTGRWFLADHDEQGGTLRAVRDGTGPQVLGVSPPYLRAGATSQLTIWGIGLDGPPDLGAGVTVNVVSQAPDAVVVQAAVAPGAAVGPRNLTVGGVGDAQIVLFNRVDAVQVEPPLAVARVGGNGGPLPPVTAQFEAVAYLNGPDGKPTVRLGVVPASWSVTPSNNVAKANRDVDFAGTLDPDGLFSPGLAGPNPARNNGWSNTGDLSVTATFTEAERALNASAHLIVTAQRWTNSPIP